jgi:hypothetical protein
MQEEKRREEEGGGEEGLWVNDNGWCGDGGGEGEGWDSRCGVDGRTVSVYKGRSSRQPPGAMSDETRFRKRNLLQSV